ncbi:MAG: 30S ribosome-binding factor RbfA [Phycisphaeraceae bacterium]|nr:30S ribosome-binding factor RbfA [Phycisphaeraceae bacterium]
MNQRVERVASTLREALQAVIARGLADPRARGLITVTEVRVTDDLKKADVFVSVLPDEHQELTLHSLRHAARHIRRQAGELMALRELPELVFKTDRGIKQQAAVIEALAKVRAERQQTAESEASDDQPDNQPTDQPEGRA